MLQAPLFTDNFACEKCGEDVPRNLYWPAKRREGYPGYDIVGCPHCKKWTRIFRATGRNYKT